MERHWTLVRAACLLIVIAAAPSAAGAVGLKFDARDPVWTLQWRAGLALTSSTRIDEPGYQDPLWPGHRVPTLGLATAYRFGHWVVGAEYTSYKVYWWERSLTSAQGGIALRLVPGLRVDLLAGAGGHHFASSDYVGGGYWHFFLELSSQIVWSFLGFEIGAAVHLQRDLNRSEIAEGIGTLHTGGTTLGLQLHAGLAL